MSTVKTFPMLGTHIPGRTLRAVPWSLVEPHRAQAMRNHDQTLERLAERGGLDPIELLAVLEDRPYPWAQRHDYAAAEARIVALMNACVHSENSK